MKTYIFFLFFIFILQSVSHANCFVDPSETETVQNKIKSSKNCSEAVAVAENCSWGSSYDVSLVAEAINVCDNDREPLAPAEQSTYDFLVKKCSEKFESTEGTLYRSLEAFCILQVAETYSSIFSTVPSLGE